MKDNIAGFPGYHITKDGKVYSCLIQGGSINKSRWIMPKHGKGLDSPRSILSNQQRKQRRILRLYQLGFNYKEIGTKVNIKPKVISRFISFRNSLE